MRSVVAVVATCVVLASGACSSHGGGSAKQTTASPNNGGGSSFAGNGAGGAFGTSGNGGAQAGGGSGGTGTLGDAGASSADAAMMVATGPGSVVAAPQDDAQFLWDDTQLRTFELTIAQSDLDAINAAPADEQFVPAAFKVGNETVQNAAVRYKGSIGAFYGCVSGGTFWQPSGMKTCKKLSMKVSFDEYDAKQRFHGLKKLNFHSMNDDDSLLRDRLGYAMFREAGIAAPRCVHARLMINGTFAGLFALVEEIDGRFTDTHFTAVGDGNLYKEIWPSTTDVSAYRVALRTHQSDPNAPIDRIVRFASAIGAASDDTAVNTEADGWLDRKYTMDYIAVDRTILNDDGMFHWYCNAPRPATGNTPGACSNHNYYWYEEAGWDRLWLVAWDLSLSLKGETSFTHVVDQWNDTSAACVQKSNGTLFSPEQLPPACDKLMHAWAVRTADYKAAVRRFLDGPYKDTNVTAKLDAWSAQIQDAVSEAASAGHTPTASAWQSEVSTLKTAIADLRTAAEARAQ